MAESVPVRFEPGGPTVWVKKGVTVLEAGRLAGRPISAPCAGRGVCGGCGVRVLEGVLGEPDEAEMAGLRRAPGGVRLACRAVIEGPVTIRPVVARATYASARAVPGSATGDTRSPTEMVAAVDLGTSSVAAVVIERESRVEVGRGVASNRQSAWGADVISRIAAASAGEGTALQQAAEASILDALLAACTEEGLCLKGIVRLVVAGNSAMAGLLLGADVGGLASYPFTAPVEGMSSLPPDSAVLQALAEGAESVVLPPLAGFVGGDVLAGLVAEGFAEATSGILLDLGTNAEVVQASPSGLVVASAAAGPAFEAGGISHGGPAADGAIQSVSYDAQHGLVVSVIGGGEPQWLCGSGLVSAVALLRRLGHVDADGLLSPSGPLADRFVQVDGVRAVSLTAADSTSGVVLTQLDIRAFQLAKAAVRSAMGAVWRRSGGAVPEDVVVAGAFGSALDIRDLVELGAVPREYAACARIAGNTSLLGAAMIAMDPGLQLGLGDVAARVDHVELALEPGFAEGYLPALRLEPWTLG